MVTALVLGICAALGAPAFAQQQTGALVVNVRDKQSGEPVAGAQVTVGRLGGITDPNGRFLFTAVPAGAHVVTVTFLGFTEGRATDVRVAAGATATVTIQLEEAVLSLQEIVVTGVTDPTAGVKLPYSVSRVGAEQLQVPNTGSALGALQGKVAGAQIVRPSGQPGTGVNILLRSPTGFEMNNSPLIVVDGVVISRDLNNTTVDIESLDIESIEVIKGAAAASLYGSRANAGVITITTNRGRDLPRNQTRITSRSEIGASMIGKMPALAQSHFMLMDSTQTYLINTAGERVGWANRTSSLTMRMMDQPVPCTDLACPGQTYDNVRSLYNPGRYLSQNFGLAQNSENTTFNISLTRLDEQGALEGNNGYWRNVGRFSLDHRLGTKLSFSVVGQHTRSNRDVISGSPFVDIYLYPSWVDLRAKGPDGGYIMVPDPDVEQENPLWRQTTRHHYDARARTLGSLSARYNPLQWVTFDAQLSYDRADTKFQEYVPKGVPTSATSDVPALGSLRLNHRENDTYNGSVGATFMRQFGDLNARFTTRGTFEKEATEFFEAEGRDFIVQGVRDLDATRVVHNVRSSMSDIRANGMLGDLALDFRDRYIGSVLFRRDGSSLFGPDERWQNYKRVAAAYRISQEDWFNLPHIDELKFRYAMGEAGGRPSFSWQYESWNVSRTAGLTRENSGNSQLKPTFTREQEFGIDIIGFNNRVSLELVYARQVSKDQIIIVPATVATGYSSLRANAGEMTGHSYEATIEAHPIRRRNTRWSMNLVMDKSETLLTSWERACFWGSNTGREHEFTCAGERAGTFYVWETLRQPGQLPTWITEIQGPCPTGPASRRLDASVGSCADEFVVNDEGYLVWVGRDSISGEIRSWRDGYANRLWGTTNALGGQFNAGGYTYHWGRPFQLIDEEGNPLRKNAGSSLPDLSLGFGNNFRYKGFSTYAQIRGQIGGKVYNRAKHYLYVQNGGRHADNDQSGKPEELRKNTDYYAQGLGRGNACNGGGADCGTYVDHFLEDATHVKLGELRVSYRFNQEQLRRLMGNVAPSAMAFGLNGRNLFTLTNYSGMDPERGSNLSRVEYLNYPHLRNFTATVDITF
jgi:TonB-linked SusC/RagA family outer membrane protein